MKNRKFPYGYEMQNGEIIVCQTEADTLKQIFIDYISGANLKEIADSLTSRQTEYLPGETKWNKCRIKRMIEDKRYLGDDTYTAIISGSVYEQANAVKDSRCNVKDYTVQATDKELLGMVSCACCGAPITHRTDNTQKKNETWYCKTEHCASVKMSLAKLKQGVTDLLNLLIDAPELTDITESKADTEPSIELCCMENELERSLEALDFNKDSLRLQIMQCAAKKYSESADTQYITDRLKADFAKASPLSQFSMELTGKTVSAIMPQKDGMVQIRLKNGKIIGKEPNINADTDNRKESACNTAKAGVCC